MDQGNLLRGIDEKTFKEMEFQFVHICSLFCNTLFIAKFFNTTSAFAERKLAIAEDEKINWYGKFDSSF